MRSLWIGLAFILLTGGLPATAAENELTIDDYTRALAGAPHDYKYKYYLYRGKAYSRNKDYERAIKDFSASLYYSDTGIEGYVERGKAFMKTKAFSSAATDFGKALEINPRNTELYRYRAEAFAGCGKFDPAISDAKKLVALNRGKPDYLAFLADLYVRKGDYKAAKATCEKALRLDFNNSYALRVKQDAFEHEPEKIVLASRPAERPRQTADRRGNQDARAGSPQPPAPVAATPSAASTQPQGYRGFIQAARAATRQ